MSLLNATELVKHFRITGGVFGREVGRVHAVNGVDLAVEEGESVGLVGESGCGKTTLGKTLVRLLEPTAGKIVFEGTDITHAPYAELRPLKRRMQIIFQDPYGSLNPRMTVETMLGEVLRFHRVVPRVKESQRIDELLALTGLGRDARRKYPHEFSGGQRQRIGIARALAVEPRFILADEPVSALDVSIQAQVLNLLQDLGAKLKLTYLLVSHDLKVVQHFCDRVLVMYLGRIVEELPCADLEEEARHPYTQALLRATPIDDPRERKKREVLQGDVPSPIEMPAGCAFASRCPLVENRCRNEVPELLAIGPAHRVACHAVS